MIDGSFSLSSLFPLVPQTTSQAIETATFSAAAAIADAADADADEVEEPLSISENVRLFLVSKGDIDSDALVFFVVFDISMLTVWFSELG